MNWETIGLGVLVGGAIGSSYTRTLRNAETPLERLDRKWKATNEQLNKVAPVIRYRNVLEDLRRKQA